MKSLDRARMLRALDAALRWWIDELSDLARDLWTRFSPRPAESLLLALETDGWTLWRTRSGAREELARGTWTGAPESLVLPTLPEGLAAARLDLTVPLRDVLRREVPLPLAAEPVLAHTLALQWPRLLPLRLERLYVDYRVAARDASGQRLTVEIAAARRDRIDPLLEALRRQGFRPGNVGIAEPAPGSRQFSLVAARSEASRDGAQSWSRLERALVGSAAVLLVSIGAVAGLEFGRERGVLAERVEEAERAAHAARAARSALNERLEPAEFLLRTLAQPTAGVLLASLSDAVPRNSWLLQWDLQGKDLRLIAITQTGTDLVGALNRATTFEAVRLQKTVPAAQSAGHEQMELALVVKDSP